MTKVGRFSFTDDGRIRRRDSSEEEFLRKLHEGDEEPEEKETENEGETPIQKFKRASDRRHNIGRATDRSASGAANAAKTPMERFQAASRARRGVE